MGYRQEEQIACRNLQSGSQVYEPAYGLVECAFVGKGHNVLISHGGGGGYDMFSADTPFEQYDQCKWFGVSAWETSPGELPSKETVLDTMTKFKALVESRLSKLTDKDLLAPEETHPWTGQTRLSKLLFSLRHTQHHLGEINAELIGRGIEGGKWK